MGETNLPAPSWDTFWTTWVFSPGWLLVCLLAAVGYAVGLRAARRHGRRGTHPARVVCFVAGIVILAWTTSGFVIAYAMTRFWIHMCLHLILIMLVPFLVVLGHPLEVTRNALGDAGRARFDRIAQSGPVALLTHPVVGLGLYTGVIVATHLTGFMDSMSMSPWLMTGEQVLYLVTGLIYFLPIIGHEPIRWNFPMVGRLLLALLGMTPDALVGIVLMQSTENLWPMYMSMRGTGALDPVRDQYVGGSIMWFFGDGLMMLAGIVLALDFISHPAQNATMGTWLEGVRRANLAHEVSRSGEAMDATSLGDVDDDDAALDAYNRMLRRMAGREPD